uniref:NADH dehydrogenase subunit 3 n=1 Tax=Hydroptila angulata TaxID=1875522 RepID=UPI0022DCDF9C|nr:NADH dehydrogenase subunit 3 [Hydroptila angulata]UZZ44045.1 NADH dehydrogenase subunit 3 [Hydroptila angulata]
MFGLIFMTTFSLFMANLFMIIAYTLSKKKQIMIEKFSSFECGFTPQSSSRIPISMHFFFIALIFLIFDVEIVLIMPMILIMKINNIFLWSFSCVYFFLILLLSILHEWNQMMLNWNN